MANEYLIQNTTLTAIANAIRGKLGESNYTLNEGLLGLEVGTLIIPAVVSYVEFVDYNGKYDGVQTDDGAPDSFGWYGYIADNNGVNTLVLYKNDPGSGYQEADTLEPFFHVGRAEVDGAEYDKWRKIELGDNKEFLWDSAAKKYIYTNVITEAPTDAIGPLDMPAKIAGIETGSSSSLETVSVTIERADSAAPDINVYYAGINDSGEVIARSVVLAPNIQYEIVNVIRDTDVIIGSEFSDYILTYHQDGFTSVDGNGGSTLICHTGSSDCYIAVSQRQVSTSEDLSAELAAQDELIADIKTAVAGKAGGGGTIETCNLTIHAGGTTGTECCIPYINDNGALAWCCGYESLYGDQSFRVPKNALVFIYCGSYSLIVNSGSANFYNTGIFNSYDNMFYGITGDAEITIG